MRTSPATDNEWPERVCDNLVGRRSAARLRLSVPARLVTLYDTRRCILVDISRSGAQIGLQKPLGKNEGAVLKIAGVDQFGTVVRCDVGPNGGVNGLKFDTPLTDADVLAMRQYAVSLEDHENRTLRQEVRAWVDGS